MSETPDNAGAPGPQGGEGNGGAPAQPSLSVLAQYLKDLSFESPRAPSAFQQSESPKMEVNVDIKGQGLSPNQYEVELSVSAKAMRENEPVFIVEAVYAGVFEIRNLPKEQLEPAMLIECPRLLFPFMRQIVADATRNGNFPPLMLEPIDFAGIYMANRQRAAAGQGASA